MAKPRIVVVGSSNTDMVIQVDHIPRPGETVLGGQFSTAAGGKGANQAVAAARAGGDVVFVARVGKDLFGEQALQGFAADGIQLQHVTPDNEAPSGVALIFVGKDGQNSIAVASGANGRLCARDVESAREVIASANALLLQLETPLETVQRAAEIAFEAQVPVILNPAPARELPAELLKLTTVLTPNESEAELLTAQRISDEPSISAAADTLLARGIKTVVITLGSRGAFVASGSVRQLVPGFQVKAVDTTAAGDVFNGALAVGLAEGRELLQGVQFANAAAAISVTRLGAQPSAPFRAEIERFLRQPKLD